MTGAMAALTALAGFGSVLLAGVFLAFSDFIMRALDRTGTEAGIAAMQSINREVFRYVFMALFLGLVPVSVALAVWAGGRTGEPGGAAVLAGAALYLAGVFAVTGARNVPLNERLAALDAGSTDAAAFWSGRYLPEWRFWNSLRAVAALLAGAAYLAGLAAMAAG